MRSEWLQKLAGPYRRDNDGFKGALRLWLPAKEYEQRNTTEFIRGGAKETSKPKKNPKQFEREAFRVHAKEADFTFGHSFFGGGGGAMEDSVEESQPVEQEAAAFRGAPSPEQLTPTKRKASLHLEDSEDEDEAASNKSKKPRKATNLSSARASLFDQVSKQMTAKITSIQARVQDAKKAQTDEAAATKPSNSTDVTTRKLYNDALEACLRLVQGWADKTVLVAAAQKHNDMLKAKAEDGKEPELVDVTVEDTVAEQSPCLRLAIAAAGTSINVERGTFLRTQACMQHFAESIPATAVDADQLDKQRLIWRRMFNCVTQLETSLKKCCGDVTKHVGSLAAAAEKDAKKQRDKEAKDAAANHMAAVQKKMKQAKAEGSDAPAIFRLEQGKLTTMKVVKGNAIPSDADLSTSFVLQECSHVKTWSDNAVCLQNELRCTIQEGEWLRASRQGDPAFPAAGRQRGHGEVLWRRAGTGESLHCGYQ